MSGSIQIKWKWYYPTQIKFWYLLVQALTAKTPDRYIWSELADKLSENVCSNFLFHLQEDKKREITNIFVNYFINL